MTNKFSVFQRSLIKQLVLEADVQRLTGQEMYQYVRNQLKESISERYLNRVKNDLKHTAEQQLSLMRKHRTAFIQEVFFKRVTEVQQLQRETWKIYKANNHNPMLQKDCLKELHNLTITLAGMWDALPSISGITFITKGGLYNGEKDISEALRNIGERNGQGNGESSSDSYRPVV